MGGKFDKEKQVFFFNPFPRVRIDLPNLPSESAFGKFSFSGLPTNSEDCVVVEIHTLLTLTEIAVIKPGEENWRIEELELHDSDEIYTVNKFCLSSNPIIVNGYCYCLVVDGKVGVFDPQDIKNSLEILRTKLSRQNRASLIQSFMVESDGKLIGVFLNNNARISVQKLDIASKRNWMNVEDLGDKVIYLSNDGSRQWRIQKLREGGGANSLIN